MSCRDCEGALGQIAELRAVVMEVSEELVRLRTILGAAGAAMLIASSLVDEEEEEIDELVLTTAIPLIPFTLLGGATVTAIT